MTPRAYATALMRALGAWDPWSRTRCGTVEEIAFCVGEPPQRLDTRAWVSRERVEWERERHRGTIAIRGRTPAQVAAVLRRALDAIEPRAVKRAA